MSQYSISNNTWRMTESSMAYVQCVRSTILQGKIRSQEKGGTGQEPMFAIQRSCYPHATCIMYKLPRIVKIHKAAYTMTRLKVAICDGLIQLCIEEGFSQYAIWPIDLGLNGAIVFSILLDPNVWAIGAVFNSTEDSPLSSCLISRT